MSAVLAELPALPLHEAGKYVAGAYVVLFALVLVYVAIMAIRQGRIERELGELLRREQDTPDGGGEAADTSGADAQQGAGEPADPARRESTLV
jgi:hypothetical protein